MKKQKKLSKYTLTAVCFVWLNWVEYKIPILILLWIYFNSKHFLLDSFGFSFVYTIKGNSQMYFNKDISIMQPQ